MAILGVGLWILFLVPPFIQWSARYEYVQAIQFCVFGIVTPSLLVAGAPWRRLGLASRERHRVDADGLRTSPQHPRPIDRLAIVRSTKPGHRRAVTLVLLSVVMTVIWRSSPVVNSMVRHPWLMVVESLFLVFVGVMLWLDLIESPPLTPGTTRPYRIGMSAAVMWTVWVVGYLEAMSHDSWYPAFHHLAGHGVSLSADQQLTAGFMWFLSAAAFLPVVFWNLIHWLQAEEDPDDELYRLVRDERTRGFFGPTS